MNRNITNLAAKTERFLQKIAGLTDLLIYFFLALVLSMVIWSLNKGLLFHDEAFYLLHLKDLEIFSTSYWYVFARIIYPQEIVQIRWITLTMLFISHLIFVTSMSIYFNSYIKIKIKQFITLLALSLLGQFVLWMPVQFIPSYWLLNYVLILSSIGFLLISFKQSSNRIAYTLSFITGLLIGFIPFIMVTNVPFILLLLIVAYFHLKSTGIKHMLVYFSTFFLGIIVAFLLYFIFIQNFSYFIDNLIASINHLSHDQTHGLLPIIKWIIKSIQYIASEILILSLVIILSDLFVNRQTFFWLKISISIISIAAIGFMIAQGFILSNETGIFSPSIFLVLFFVLLYKNLHLRTIDTKQLWVFLMLFLMPFIASLGTNVHFILRGVAYMSVIFVTIFILSAFLNDNKYKVIFIFFLFVATVSFMRSPFIAGWTYQVLSEQKKPVSQLGIHQNILIDQERFQNLEKLKNIIPENNFVIVSHRSFWGYVYLLDLKIPYLYFDFSEKLFFEQIRLHPEDINNFAFIELNTIPFPEGFFERLKSVGYDEEKFQKINITDQIVVYKSKNDI